MSAFTFLQLLSAEVARMQTLHPEREGELARAHALILHGQVLPSADDPETGAVLSSDLSKTYTVNGTCDCQAGAHGKECKHRQAWKLYRYIQGKVEAQEPASTIQTAPDTSAAPPVPTGLPEAPASVNCHIPADLVVDRWTSDGERGLHRHFLFRQDVWTMFRG
jgi:hypothetical protein